MGEQHNKKLWTPEVSYVFMKEDQVLKQAVSIIQSDKWNTIAKKHSELFYQKYSVTSTRSGKQCRQRWYNKLHPDLDHAIETWTTEQSQLLIQTYEQLGPKWAKIIFRLCESGFKRRSDNNIKNHFHLLVKKSLKDLNVFIEEYNRKIKESGLAKAKKVYVYEKSYTIQKMVRMQLPSFNNNNFHSKRKSPVLIDNHSNLQKIQTQLPQQMLIQKIEGKSLIEQKQNNQNIRNKQEQQPSKSPIAGAESTEKKEDQGLNYLKPIDKKAIDRLWLWSNDKTEGRLTITQSVEETELKNLRSIFLSFMINADSFLSDQKKKMVEEITNYSKCCKKLSKRNIVKIVKEKKLNSRYLIERETFKMYKNLTDFFPQKKKICSYNKKQIIDRLTSLIKKLLIKKKQLDEQINPESILNKKDSNKIFSIVAEQILTLTEPDPKDNNDQQPLNNEQINDQEIKAGFVNIEVNNTTKNNQKADKTSNKSKENKKKQKVQKTELQKEEGKIIRRRIIRKPIKKELKNKNIQKSQCSNKQQLQNFLVKKQDEPVPFVPKIEETFQANSRQLEQPHQILPQNILLQCKKQFLQQPAENDLLPLNEPPQIDQKPEEDKIQKLVDQNQVQIKNQTVQDEKANFLDKGFSKKNPNSQAVGRVSFNRIFEEKHIQQEKSEFSFNSKKSIRPKILFKQSVNPDKYLPTSAKKPRTLNQSIQIPNPERKEKSKQQDPTKLNQMPNHSVSKQNLASQTERSFPQKIQRNLSQQVVPKIEQNLPQILHNFPKQIQKNFPEQKAPKIQQNFQQMVQNFPQQVTSKIEHNFSSQMVQKFPPQMEQSFHQEIQRNFPPQMGQNFTSQMGQNFPPQMGQNFPPQMGQNLPAQMGQNFTSQMGQNFTSQMGQNFTSQMGQNFTSQMGQNFTSQMGQNLPAQIQGHFPPQIGFQSNPFFYQNPFVPNLISVDPFKNINRSQEIFMSLGRSTNCIPANQAQGLNKSRQFLAMSCSNIPQPKVSIQNQKAFFVQADGNFTNNSFLQNIRKIQQNQLNQEKISNKKKEPHVFNFDSPLKEDSFYNGNKSNRGSAFNPFNSQQLDFEIPQKLVQKANNPSFPIKNYNDYSQNYQHVNSLDFSKLFELQRKFGFNSGQLSELDLFKSEDKSMSNIERLRQNENGLLMFQSQRIRSLNESSQLNNRSRFLSNSCKYSNQGSRQPGSIQQIENDGRIKEKVPYISFIDKLPDIYKTG